MRKVTLALVALCLCAGVAGAGWKSESTASIANAATYTGKGWYIGDASTVTVCLQFTTAATAGNVTLNVDVSLDRGTTWVLGYTTDTTAISGANTYIRTFPLVGNGKPIGTAFGFCPAPTIRLRATNNLTTAAVAATSVTLGVIYN